MHQGLSFRVLAWERDERRPPPQILSFLPPCLHSKSLTSGVSGSGGDQPIGVELRTDRSLSPFCCSGQSATKEGCCGLIPINFPGAEACQDCHHAVPPPVEYFGIIRAENTPGVGGIWGVKGLHRSNEAHRCQTQARVVYSFPLLYLAHPFVVHLEDSKQSLKQGANFILCSKNCNLWGVLTFSNILSV